MNQENVNSNQPCYSGFEFGLFVTGETEEQHLPGLFKILMETGICTFKVIRRIGQLNPRTSTKKHTKYLQVVNADQTMKRNLPYQDQNIFLQARTFLSKNQCRYVLVIDDLEKDRIDIALQVFQRYREALDTLSPEQKKRASVHFLVNMIEAYYFADAQAINTVLGTSLEDHLEDVETIPHPKNELKASHPGFDEKEDGGKIIKLLRVEHILSRHDTCGSLRTLFYWCYKVLQKYPYPDILELFPVENCHFYDGILSDITRHQLDDIE